MNNLSIEQRKILYTILTTTIVVDKKLKNISLKSNIIYSPQRYINSSDPDMSDFTISFYEILYENMLKNRNILNNRRNLFEENFAGDTMNSFNSIANLVPEAGKSSKKRASEEKWPFYLKNYFYFYPCLANFWILPKNLGRTGTKLNYYDSLDLFLLQLKNNFEIYKSQYTDYFENIKDFNTFIAVHKLPVNLSHLKLLRNF